ncbi:uncharacterized protein METZ01_LOCUS147126, partial [marine metagenome]
MATIVVVGVLFFEEPGDRFASFWILFAIVETDEMAEGGG